MEITIYTLAWIEQDSIVVELYLDESKLKLAERTLKDDGIEHQVDTHPVYLTAEP